MKKKIAVADLSLGMFVGDVFNSANELLISANTMIVSERQIDKFQKTGFTHVIIDTERGIDVKKAPMGLEPLELPVQKVIAIEPSDETKRERDYFQELNKAKVVHRQAILIVKHFYRDIRFAKVLDPRPLLVAVDEMMSSIFRNADALPSLIRIKDVTEYVFNHSVNVSILSIALGKALGYKKESIFEVGLGALLQDCGMMRMPESLMNKKGIYSKAERKLVEKHPIRSVEIIKNIREVPTNCLVIAEQHHERWNGRGYPHHLKGNEIHAYSLIASIADVYDAITSAREYRPARTPQSGLATIFKGSNIDFSREYVQLLTKIIGVYPVGSFVKLNDNSMGIVTQVDKGKLLHPRVLILFNSRGDKLDKPYEIDTSEKLWGTNTYLKSISGSLNPEAFNTEVNKYLEESHGLFQQLSPA